MNAAGRVVLWVLTAGALAVVILHHAAYLRRRRPYSFGAFLETAGWIVITLTAIAALGGGLAAPGTRTVEIAAAVVGVLFIGIGSLFR